MHIVVGTRSTPDTAARLEVAPDGRVSWGDAPLVINPWDEYAVEEALLRAKAGNGIVTVIALGPEEHNEALKYALAMGADRAIRLWDDAWSGLDSRGYAAAFAAAVRRLGDVDLVIFGKEAADEASDVHIFQTARALGWTLLSAVAHIEALDSSVIRVEQSLEEGRQIASGPLPAVISVLRGINEPRYPSFIGIRKAARAEIPVWDTAALGVSLPAPASQVSSFRLPPAREGACEIIGGDTVEAQVAALVEKLLAEKVI
ncbi:MAG: electron transfer flavoprotein subunit beta/FixA family protein [Anaerolineae bacterium]|nr:electron transfer flavoprotein subunit beta/FixA family protein [Anaerolineae bacterium]